MEKSDKLFSEGLAAGYAGKAETKKVNRSGFTLESARVATFDGLYYDEWAADKSGGGQELVRTLSGEIYTRVYAGGTISDEELANLGITEKDVSEYLKKKLKELGNKTRLDEDCIPESDGDWKYEYGVIAKEPSIPLTLGRENIYYKDNFVFVHVLARCPIK